MRKRITIILAAIVAVLCLIGAKMYEDDEPEFPSNIVVSVRQFDESFASMPRPYLRTDNLHGAPNIYYEASVENNSKDELSGTQLIIPVPDGLLPQFADGCFDSHKITCDIPELQPGERTSIRWRFMPKNTSLRKMPWDIITNQTNVYDIYAILERPDGYAIGSNVTNLVYTQFKF